MITGFNPADMYAADHIRRVLTTFPGVFSGIGEFTIHKEFVSSKIAGETASLTNPALDRILDFAGEVGLVGDPAQRHRHAVREAGHRAGVPDADEGAAQAASERPRSSGRTSASAASSTRCRSSAEAAERSPSHVEIVRGDAGRSGARPRELRHLVGRGREVRRRLAGDHRARRGDAEQVPGPVPVRDRHGGAGRPGAVFRGVRHVGAGLEAAHAGREPESAQRQLRTDSSTRRRKRVRAWEQANPK